MDDMKRKVLFLDQFGAIGGGQRILLDLVAAARGRGWSVTLLCPAGPLTDAAERSGAMVQSLDLPIMRNGTKPLLAYLRMALFSRGAAQRYLHMAEGSDLIVVNGLRTLGIARAWARKLQKPMVLYLHGTYGGFQRFLVRSFLALPRTAAIAPSDIVAAPFRTLRNVHVIANWVAPEFLSAPPQDAALRQRLHIVDALPLVLVPGRFSPNKGQRLVLEAWKRLGRDACHLVFSGAALFEEAGAEVERSIHEAMREFPGRVHCVQWEQDLPALYDGADLVLVPSVWEEPFGLTAIEAMARARPLIVTDRGMLPRLTEEGKYGQVVRPDASSIAQAIQAFLSDRRRWEERAGESRVHVLRHYHPQENSSKVFQLFAALLSA